MDKDKDGVDDRAETIAALIAAFSPLLLFAFSFGCLTVMIVLPNLEEATKIAIADTQSVSFSSGLALLGLGRRREKNGKV